MKFKILLFSFFAALITMTSCNEPKGLTISGSVENADNLTAYLDKKTINNVLESLGNQEIKGGKFSFNFPESLDPGMYRLRIGAKAVELVIKGDEKKVNVTGDVNTFQTFDYAVSGSDLSSEFRGVIKSLIDKTLTQQDFFNKLQNEYDPLLATALVFGTSPANPELHTTYRSLADRLTESYPEESLTAEMSNFAALMKKNYDMQQSKYKVRVGQPAPDIVMEDTNGKVRKLSDLKGQVVLLDFWASWCGPCRRANPKVVDTYHKYKDEGFTVFNVSLDGLDERTKKRFQENQLGQQLEKSKQRWLDAIEKDQLVWDNHVSDLKKWDSAAAATYGVRSIPTTFLIDREGNIAVLNPNKNRLESEIKKLI